MGLCVCVCVRERERESELERRRKGQVFQAGEMIVINLCVSSKVLPRQKKSTFLFILGFLESSKMFSPPPKMIGQILRVFLLLIMPVSPQNAQQSIHDLKHGKTVMLHLHKGPV